MSDEDKAMMIWLALNKPLGEAGLRLLTEAVKDMSAAELVKALEKAR